MYKINDLPYDYDALEPFIDTHTLGLHYNKHQRNYLNKLNELLEKIIIVFHIAKKIYINI